MSSKPRVVITDFIDDDLAAERGVLGDWADVQALQAQTVDQLDERFEQADVVMMYHFLKMDQVTLRRLQRCRLIVRCGVGFDNVDIQAARELGIPVANIPDYGTEEVADAALGLMLNLLRGISWLNELLKDPQQEWHYRTAMPLRRLRQRVCGVIGCGRIGGAFALRAKALGMDVVFYDPYVPDGRDKSLGIRRAESLADLLSQADVISVHCPLSNETHHLLNRETLATCRRDAVLINTARGGVVDQNAVLAALEQGTLAGAALDVLEHEPPDADEPILRAWRDPEHPAHRRLILNPHSAFYSEEGLLDMRVKGAQNILRVLKGEPPRNVVNP